MKNTILILGGDGYLGWPLAIKVALKYPGHKILIIDNEWRRNTVQALGFQPLFAISHLSERIAAFRDIYAMDNLHYLTMDVNSNALEQVIARERPHTVYHLAQQCSAPYSMLGVNQSIYTIRNNEEGNMRLLWAVKQHIPDAHIIKLGSFGEYAKGGINIAEGYFEPVYNGLKASDKMPYPREANDIYHITKTNDSNFAAMATRVWGLRITDVMQSTIFGLTTNEMAGCEALRTRFDYDHIFGTVVNRFLTQAVSGYPLSVYGKGNQRTGLMALRDAVNSMACFVEDAAMPGEHRVINHITETDFSINELADKIKATLAGQGYDIQITHTDDPRKESSENKLTYKIETTYAGHKQLHSSFEDAIIEMAGVIDKYKSNVDVRQFTPRIFWDRGSLTEAENGYHDQTASLRDYVGNEDFWNTVRVKHFPGHRVNLNPGTFGTTLASVQKARETEFQANSLNGYPLSYYKRGQSCCLRIRALCDEIWPSQGYVLSLMSNTSQSINLIALALIRKLYTVASLPFKIVTTHHEHIGGIGAFEALPEFEVHYFDDAVLNDAIAMRDELKRINPDVALFSHVTYDTGILAPVERWMELVGRYAPNCKIILDIAQSLGLHNIPFGQADVITGSTHKWLFGPHGGGITWVKKEFVSWIGGLFWNTNDSTLLCNTEIKHFNVPGGQDFQIYDAIEACLIHYQKIGKDLVLKRSHYLAKWLQNKLELLFSNLDINYFFLNNGPNPVITLAFRDFDPYELYNCLNGKGFHLKCIKYKLIGGEYVNILRFGIPYYETKQRLAQLILLMSNYLLNKSDSSVLAVTGYYTQSNY